LYDVSANIAVFIFRVNVYWLGVLFFNPYLEQVVCGDWDVTKQTGGLEDLTDPMKMCNIQIKYSYIYGEAKRAD
jgi:hypothetical protein